MPPERNHGEAEGGGHKPRSPLNIGQVVAGKYQIEATLGSGGMGAVYVARNLRTRKTWALKVLHPEFSERPEILQRFLVEAQAAGVIGHPGIVEIIDQDRDGNLHFLVMPKLEGEELAARIIRGHPLSASFVMRVGADVADAIEAAHRAKIVHRDLKPANVFLALKGGRPDVVQILDFGIAKLTDDENIAQALTHTRDVYGTPHYMSPEQLRSAKEVDERTDIYAIGVILYEALAGRTPFRAESFTDLVVRIMTENPPPLQTLRPELPPGLVAIVNRAMARNREDRFLSAAALRDALATCAQTGATDQQALANTISAPPPPPSQIATLTAPAVRGRRRALTWVLAAAGVGGLATAGWLLQRSSSPDPAPVERTATSEVTRPTAAADAAGSQTDTALVAPTAPPQATPPAITPPASETSRATRPAAPARKRHAPSSGSGTSDLPPLRPR